MGALSVKHFIECGVHFGHRVSRWNPKMAPYIFGKRNLIHIINLRETIRGILRGCNFLSQVSSVGEKVLFVGTKRQARTVIKQEAARCGMPYVSERWLGGTLTNYGIVRQRLQRLEMLESMEQGGSISQLNKKEISRLMREKKKLIRNLDGIRLLDRLPGAVVIVDPKREVNALKEAHRLRIPVIAMLDTDCDPEMVDICVPGNDDAMRAIQCIVARFSEAISEGRKAYQELKAVEEKRKAEEKEKEEAAQVKKFVFREGEEPREEPLEEKAVGKESDKPVEKKDTRTKGPRPRKPRVVRRDRFPKDGGEKEGHSKASPAKRSGESLPKGAKERAAEKAPQEAIPARDSKTEKNPARVSPSPPEGGALPKEEEGAARKSGDLLNAKKEEGGSS